MIRGKLVRVTLAAATSALVGAALITAPAAQAYPPGQSATVSAVAAVKSGGTFVLSGAKWKPGCLVSVFRGQVKLGAVRVRPNKTWAFAVRAPKKAGSYRHRATGCGEVASTVIRVKKAQPVLRAPRTVVGRKAFVVSVANFPKLAPVTFSIRKNGVRIGGVTKTINSAGKARVSFTLGKVGLGQFRVVAKSGKLKLSKTFVRVRP